MMVRTRILTVLLVGLFAGHSFAARTAGTYAVQGVIRDNAGDLFNGNLSIDVRIWDAAVGGLQVDLDGDNVITAADTIMLGSVPVADGNLATKFDLNTTIVFAGTSDRWMELTLNGVAQTRTEIQSQALAYQMRFPGSDDLAIITNATNEIEVFAALKSGNLTIDGTVGPDATLSTTGDFSMQAGVSLMSMNAITGTITIDTLAASSTADGTALATVPIVLDPVNNTISSGASKIKLNTVAGTVEINSSILSGTAQATTPIVLDPVNNTISSGNAEMEMDAAAGLFLLRSRILSGATAEGGVAQVSEPIEIDPNLGTISRGNAEMEMDSTAGLFLLRSRILSGASAEGGVAQASLPIEINPNAGTLSSGNARITLDTATGETKFDSLTGGVAQSTPSMVINPTAGTIGRGSAQIALNDITGETVISGGLTTSRLAITGSILAAGASGSTSSAAGPSGVELVLNGNGTLELTINGEIVDRWTPQGNAGSGLAANRISGSSFNTAAPGKFGITILGGGTGPTNDPILCPAPDPPCVDNAHHGTDFWATIAGGNANTAGLSATVSGGQGNDATGQESVISGGSANRAIGFGSVIAGGIVNDAIGIWGFVPGGLRNTAGGNLSFAGGTRAVARGGDHGCFVWADSQDVPADFVIGDSLNNVGSLDSSGPNQFVVRAAGGFWLGTAGATSTADSTRDDAFIPAGRLIQTTAGVSQACRDACADQACILVCEESGAHLSTGGTWTNSSDRNSKEYFTAINRREILDRVLDIEITRWNYKSEDRTTRHLGPMAQDFFAAFGLGASDKTISTIDADGVALAAIQGLHDLVKEKEARIAAVEVRNTELEARIAALEDSIGVRDTSARAGVWGMATPGLALAGMLGLVAIGRNRKGGAR